MGHPVYVNIRLLNKNLDKFQDYIEFLLFIPCVLCLFEICINNQPHVNIERDRYNFININPESNAHGVATYIHIRIKYIYDQCSLYKCQRNWSRDLSLRVDRFARIHGKKRIVIEQRPFFFREIVRNRGHKRIGPGATLKL